MTVAGRSRPAEPSEIPSPAAALSTATCDACGGPYDRPWRRRTA
ncbi:hypothetical protein [Streptomyces flavofungini]